MSLNFRVIDFIPRLLSIDFHFPIIAKKKQCRLNLRHYAYLHIYACNSPVLQKGWNGRGYEGLRVLGYDLVGQCEAALSSGNCCKRKRRQAYLCELAIGRRILDAASNLMTYKRRLDAVFKKKANKRAREREKERVNERKRNRGEKRIKDRLSHVIQL